MQNMKFRLQQKISNILILDNKRCLSERNVFDHFNLMNISCNNIWNFDNILLISLNSRIVVFVSSIFQGCQILNLNRIWICSSRHPYLTLCHAWCRKTPAVCWFSSVIDNEQWRIVKLTSLERIARLLLRTHSTKGESTYNSLVFENGQWRTLARLLLRMERTRKTLSSNASTTWEVTNLIKR